MIYLFLNSISTGEVVIIMIFILMFFGSKNIPSMARTFGKGLRQIKDATDDIKRDIRHSVDEIEKDVRENMKVDKSIKETVSSFEKDIDEMIKKPKRFFEEKVKDIKDTVEGAGSPETKGKKTAAVQNLDESKKDDVKNTPKSNSVIEEEGEKLDTKTDKL